MVSILRSWGITLWAATSKHEVRRHRHQLQPAERLPLQPGQRLSTYHHLFFLPGESQGRGSPVGCRLWGHTESDTTEATQQQQQQQGKAHTAQQVRVTQ